MLLKQIRKKNKKIKKPDCSLAFTFNFFDNTEA